LPITALRRAHWPLTGCSTSTICQPPAAVVDYESSSGQIKGAGRIVTASLNHPSLPPTAGPSSPRPHAASSLHCDYSITVGQRRQIICALLGQGSLIATQRARPTARRDGTATPPAGRPRDGTGGPRQPAGRARDRVAGAKTIPADCGMTPSERMRHCTAPHSHRAGTLPSHTHRPYLPISHRHRDRFRGTFLIQSLVFNVGRQGLCYVTLRQCISILKQLLTRLQNSKLYVYVCCNNSVYTDISTVILVTSVISMPISVHFVYRVYQLNVSRLLRL